MNFLPILEKFHSQYKDIQEQLCKEEVIKDKFKFSSLSGKLSKLAGLERIYQEYKSLLEHLKQAQEIIEKEKDPQLIELAKEDLKSTDDKIKELEKKIVFLLVENKYPSENIIVEIRQGTGGQEAALFAKDLFRMYSKFCQRKGLKIEVLDSHPTDIGGFKEIIFSVKGKGAHNIFKDESGVHRVQRVPVTESGGRIHTSTATVAVLEEPQEIELKINPEELKIETFRASGHGGQHVNVTDSAVRITHLPTGIVVSCQDERSQIKNREKAMRILRARLYQYLRERQISKISQERKQQVGTGERSEKVRTYNFPENRVTDHRVQLTLYKLDKILEGELDEIIEALQKKRAQEEQEQYLKDDNKI